jgi:hypothetical protein
MAANDEIQSLPAQKRRLKKLAIAATAHDLGVVPPKRGQRAVSPPTPHARRKAAALKKKG